VEEGAPNNLFHPVPGDYGAHGRFDSRARARSWEVFTSRHRNAMWAVIGLGAAVAVGLSQGRKHRQKGKNVLF
jgi:hypothetical protein